MVDRGLFLLHQRAPCHRHQMVVGIRCPSAPSPSPITPTWYPFPTPRVFSAATGLLQASFWPHHKQTGANLALLPWNAELGSALRDVLTKLD